MTKMLKVKAHQYSPFPPAFARTLVLDDSEFDRMRVRRLLQMTNFNHSMEEVVSVCEFVTCVKKNHYNLVILDFDLPDGTGFEALKVLHEVSPRHPIGALMISGKDCLLTKSRAVELGCAEYIPKRNLSLRSFKPAFLKAVGVTAL